MVDYTLEIRHLKQVVALHKQGSFAKAAQSLGISQPTLSKSIARLEDELGFRLFERGTSGASITPLGLHVVTRAERMLADAALLSREIAMMSAGERGQVSIGVGSVLASAFLPQFVTEMARLFPELAVRLIVGPRESVMEGLRRATFDIIFVADSQDIDEQEFCVIPLASEPIVAVSAPDHPLAARRALTSEDLLDHAMATLSSTYIFELRRVLGLATSDPHKGATYSSNDFSALKALALSGAAAVLGPRHAFRADCEAGLLVELDFAIDFQLSFVAIMTRAAANWSVLSKLADAAKIIAGDLTR